MKPIAFNKIGLSLALAVCTLPAVAQNQPTSQSAPAGESLGNYARQVRKDSGSPSKPKVFDNDNLPREDKLSVVGTARAPEAPAEAKQGDQTSAAPASAGKHNAIRKVRPFWRRPSHRWPAPGTTHDARHNRTRPPD